MADPTILLSRERFPGRPLLDTAVSRALLEGVAAGTSPETLRVFVPERVLAFGSRDATRPTYPAAEAAARAAGFTPVVRLAGGRAAVFHEGTVGFSWTLPEPEPWRGITARFERLAEIVVEALVSLGVDARVGEVPGEYCPGAHSVNAAGRRKLMGVGQRLVAGGAHVGGVVVVEGRELVNRALAPVYAALGYSWDPEATGCVADEAPATVAQVERALLAAFSRRFHLVEAPLPTDVLTRAAALVGSRPG
jgi:octanoyl-[GcvH]:protein N-octanoyltransferase